jgi:hypothetical protein
MATSGSTNWTITRNEIVTRSLRIVGAISTENSPTANQLTTGVEALNAMIKAWQTDDIFLWTRDWETKTFTASSEVTGTDGNIYECIRSHTSGSSTKPITGADYTTYWYKRGTTGGTWYTSTSYSSIGDFDVASDTLDIEKAFIRDNDSDTNVDIVSFAKYLDVYQKFNTGKPYMMALDKQLTPKVYLYHPPDITTYVLHYLRVRKLEDFDASTNNPDFPVKWINAIIWGLADELSDEYGLGIVERQRISKKSVTWYSMAKKNNKETDDMQFVKGAF